MCLSLGIRGDLVVCLDKPPVTWLYLNRHISSGRGHCLLTSGILVREYALVCGGAGTIFYGGRVLVLAFGPRTHGVLGIALFCVCPCLL